MPTSVTILFVLALLAPFSSSFLTHMRISCRSVCPCDPIARLGGRRAGSCQLRTSRGDGDERPRSAQASAPIDPVRFVAFNLLAVVLALGANFLGVTSSLLSHSAEATRALRLDQLYPLDGFQRYVDAAQGFEFVFPYTWAMDPRVLAANAQLRELPASLRRAREVSNTLPGVAYVSRGRDSALDFKENLSVIRSPLLPGFSMRGTLGEPQEAAQKLLATRIAPPGSNREAALVSAAEDEREGVLAYTLEFTVRSSDNSLNAHNVAVIAAKNDALYTMTVTVPQERWEQEKDKAYEIARSFRIM